MKNWRLILAARNGMEGLIDDFEKMLDSKSPSTIKDVRIIAYCRSINHYKISRYDSVFRNAKTLNLKKVHKQLKKTRKEAEKAEKNLKKPKKIS